MGIDWSITIYILFKCEITLKIENNNTTNYSVRLGHIETWKGKVLYWAKGDPPMAFSKTGHENPFFGSCYPDSPQQLVGGFNPYEQ